MLTKIKSLLFSKNQNKSTSSQMILIIKDSRLADEGMIKTLEKFYRLVVLEKSESAAKIARREKPDLIVIQCYMPGLKGVKTVIEEIKGHVKTQHIPILFLTEMETPQNIIECFELGADNYLSKPLAAQTLLSQVKIMLEHRS